MAVTRYDVHQLVDAVPEEALPEVEDYLRSYTHPAGGTLAERLAEAGLLEDPGPRATPRPDPERLAVARRHAGEGKPLSEFVSENR
jgi:hypothetical protein